MRRAGLVAMLLAGALQTACPSQQERAESAAEEAREALARGDRVAALSHLEELRETRADTPEALLQLTELLVFAGEAPQALWLLQEGVREHPDRADLRLATATTALMVGDASAARRVLEGIDASSELHLKALLLRARAELALGDLPQALTTLSEAEELYPDDPQARFSRIAALLSERRMEEARAVLDQVREQLAGTEHADALHQVELGFYSIQIKQAEGEELEGPIAALRAMVERDPGDLAAWQELAQALFKARRIAEATGLLEAAIDADPERLDLHPILIPMLTASGRVEDAQARLRDRLERAPSPSAWAALARFYLTQGREAEASSALEEALQAYPEDAVLQRLQFETLLALEQTERAREAARAYRERFPDDPVGEYLTARLELADGDARAAVERLTRLAPELDEAATQFWLGKALQADGDLAGADRRYMLAIARARREPAVYGPALELAERRGDWSSVSAMGRQLVALAPRRFESWAAWVGGLINLGQGAAAKGEAQRCAAIFPERADAQVLLAQALVAAGEPDAALESLAAARERLGASAEIDAERALTLGMTGRIAEGLTVARQALTSEPDAPTLHAALASLLFGAGRAEEGAQAVDRALALAPDDPKPLLVRARFQAATGRFDAAAADCERYLAARPGDPQAHFILGVVREKAGDREAAIAAYRRAAELDPKDFAPRNNLALLLAESDLEAALKVGQEAYAIAPGSPNVLDTLGTLYLKRGLVDRAISLLEEARAAEPEDGDIQLHLALAYRDAGRSDDARRLLSALQSRTGAPEALVARAGEALRSLP